MKKLIIMLFILLIPCLLKSQSDFQAGKAKVTGSILNVRNISSTGGTIVAILKRGDILEVIERSKTQSEVEGMNDFWYKVKLSDNKTGWVFGQFITFDINTESGLRWKSVVPSKGQKFSSIAASSSGEIMAATEDGNIFISTDGVTWKKSSPQALGINIGRINKITIINRNIWIAASGGSRGGVWRSTNMGSSWAQITNSQGLLSNDINDVVINDKNEIFAASSKGVSMSKDEGATWVTYPDGKKLDDVICLATSKDGSVFAGTLDGLYVTSSSKPKWTQIGENSPNMGEQIFTISVSPSGNIYVGTDKGLNKASVSNIEQWFGIGGKTKVNSILVDASSRVIVATDNGLNISIDNGASWVTYNKESGIFSNRTEKITVSLKQNIIWITAGSEGLSYHD
jgi:ligand-binding sensor domain-containing protein